MWVLIELEIIVKNDDNFEKSICHGKHFIYYKNVEDNLKKKLFKWEN